MAPSLTFSLALVAVAATAAAERQKRAVVCGAGGFIGGHLVKKLQVLAHCT